MVIHAVLKLSLRLPWERMAKAALHCDLRRLRLIQIIAMWGWRQWFQHGSDSEQCPLLRGFVRHMSQYSLGQKQTATTTGL